MRLHPAYRPAVALVIAGVLVVGIGTIAQLATLDNLVEAVWASISVLGFAIGVVGVVLAARVYRRLHPHTDDD